MEKLVVFAFPLHFRCLQNTPAQFQLQYSSMFLPPFPKAPSPCSLAYYPQCTRYTTRSRPFPPVLPQFRPPPALSFRERRRRTTNARLARLRRDSARVKAIQSRLDYRLWRREKLEGAVISGTSQGSGEYFTRVGVGRPPMEAYMIVTTNPTRGYPPPSRRSRENTAMRSLDVSECRNDTCIYEVSYGDGSYTVGDFVTETVTFAGSQSVDKIAIGCGHNNEGLFAAPPV
ncbi:protein ASPARTIC PROTEASE IN GUARD CELL 1-like [Salvia hispanica]|uniref:protein ASPARTIC PROTEASE IN GUARD CELL 1-like n=1 Tax=Salvia hispanica TaxID=49212 RepID=UPI0020099CE5|nr:protein ASPARTIC PROTEASE IN GUARD CELL 1-like [Salvia hispanica]